MEFNGGWKPVSPLGLASVMTKGKRTKIMHTIHIIIQTAEVKIGQNLMLLGVTPSKSHNGNLHPVSFKKIYCDKQITCYSIVKQIMITLLETRNTVFSLNFPLSFQYWNIMAVLEEVLSPLLKCSWSYQCAVWPKNLWETVDPSTIKAIVYTHHIH